MSTKTAARTAILAAVLLAGLGACAKKQPDAVYVPDTGVTQEPAFTGKV